MNKHDANKHRFILISLTVIVALGVLIITVFKNPTIKIDETFPHATQDKLQDKEIIAQNLTIPWEIAFLPDGEILITERPGNLLLLKSGQKIPIEDIKPVGEGGLLGMTLDPDFAKNNYLYLYYTYDSLGNETKNRVARFTLENGKLINKLVLVDSIPGAINHNGGRIKFGPDKFLYIATGDAQDPSLAQDKNSLAGKILRVTDQGKALSDNPFGNLVYSYGHRNPQGLAWDDKDQLWAAEHGPSGFDELNRIEKGTNYGWPIITGDETKQGMTNPIIQSGPTVTWAPSGAVFSNGSIFFGGLRGESLFEYNLTDKSLKRHFQGEFGRIRAVVLGPDGYLYLTTSNLDGRGTPKENDDKLIRVNSDF